MQVIKYEKKGTMLTVGFKEDNFVVYTTIGNNTEFTKQQLLQRAYEQCKASIDYEKTLKEHSLLCDKEGDEFVPETSKPIKLKVDFTTLKGKVLDQYGSIVSENIISSIEGTDKAKIEDGKIVEEYVLTDTDYFIVAKYMNLIEKQKRTIYSTKIVQEKVDDEKIAIAEAIIDLNNRINKLEGGN